MAYYYVKNGGTATGDAGRYASQQTGTFAALGASGYYNDIEDAIANSTTSPVASDFINPSDLHDFTKSSGSITYAISAPIVCVSDVNIDQSRTASNRAKERAGAGGDIIVSTNMIISGVELHAEDDVSIQSNRGVRFSDCLFRVTASGDIALAVASSNTGAIVIGGEIALDATGATVTVSRGASVSLHGTVVTTTTGGVTNFYNGGFDNGGGVVKLHGCDISVVTGTLIANAGAGLEEDTINIHFDMCKIASGVAFTNEAFTAVQQRALFTRCSDSSAAAEYQYHLTSLGGTVDDDSTIRRAEDPLFEDSGIGISYEIVTDSNASVVTPLWFDFPIKSWAALSAGATDTLRFHIASTSALTDADIYIELSYPDGTNKQTPNFITSAPATIGGTFDFLATATTLTTDSGSDWRDGGSALAGHNEYLIDISTSGDVGADTVPIVKVYVTRPSVTIQLGSIFELI